MSNPAVYADLQDCDFGISAFIKHLSGAAFDSHELICVVITDRMPVILGNKDSTDRWLNDSSLPNLDTILKPYEETDLVRVQN